MKLILANLQFQVSSDRNLIGQCVPVEFYWNDCGDNAIASVSGDTTFVGRCYFDGFDHLIWHEADDVVYPDASRPQALGPPDACLIGEDPDKPKPVRGVCFFNGWICIDEPPDDRGDINLNGIANEVGDVVLFTNYFIYGSSVWDPIYQEVQILASDVNDDGMVLTVADLVYLIRIITGDEQPFPPGGNPKLSAQYAAATVDWQIENGRLTVDLNSTTDVGALLLAFDHGGAQFGEPTLSGNADGMTIISHNTGEQLRLMIYGMQKGMKIAAGDGAFLTIPVVGPGENLTLAEVDAADYWGSPIRVDRAQGGGVPREFTLLQNIPNPFNASTRITFNLPDAGEVTLTVYDVLGRSVATLADGHLEPGVHHIIWDGRSHRGRELASGVYFYRIVTATREDSRKMVLLK